MMHSEHSTMTKGPDSRCRGTGFFAVALALAVLGGTNPARAEVVPTPGQLYTVPHSYCIDDAQPSAYLGDASRTGIVIDPPSMYMSFYDTSTYSEQTVWWLPAVFTWNGTAWVLAGKGQWQPGLAQTSVNLLSCLTGNCSFQPTEFTGWDRFSFTVTPGHYYRAAIYYYWNATIDVGHGETVRVGSNFVGRWASYPPYCYISGNGKNITILPLQLP